LSLFSLSFVVISTIYTLFRFFENSAQIADDGTGRSRWHEWRLMVGNPTFLNMIVRPIVRQIIPEPSVYFTWLKGTNARKWRQAFFASGNHVERREKSRGKQVTGKK
jgi:hypothetical protein